MNIHKNLKNKIEFAVEFSAVVYETKIKRKLFHAVRRKNSFW
jgi:hypothetical protein